MNDVLIITVPGLHPDARLLGWWKHAYERVSLVTPLPDTSLPGALPVVWPLSGAEARACLEHTEILTSTMEADALRATAALHDAAKRDGAEIAEVRRRLGGKVLDAEDTDAPRRQAQHTLLLAYIQEEQVDELRVLAERYRNESERLRFALTEQMDSTDVGAGINTELPFDNAQLDAFLPSWRLVLERLTLFFPDGAAMCTTDPRMLEALEALEPGQPADPCPQALMPLADQAAQGDVRLTQWTMPLWRVCGRSSPEQAADCPWLLTERTIYGIWNMGR